MSGHKAMSILQRSMRGRVCGSTRPRLSRINRGQSSVEFAFISVFALAIMLVGIQYALIGQAAIAVSHGASSLARYAASNPGGLGTTNGSFKASTLSAAVKNLLSSSILTHGGDDLTVTVTSVTGAGKPQPGTPVPASDKVTINLSYDTTTKLAVPNPFLALPPIFPGSAFPNPVAASDSQMYE